MISGYEILKFRNKIQTENDHCKNHNDQFDQIIENWKTIINYHSDQFLHEYVSY